MTHDNANHSSAFDDMDDMELEGSGSEGGKKQPKYTYSLVVMDDGRPAYRSNIRGDYDPELGITKEDHFAHWTFGFRWNEEIERPNGSGDFMLLSVMALNELDDLMDRTEHVSAIETVDDMALVRWHDVSSELNRFCEDHVMWHLADYLRRATTDEAYDSLVTSLSKKLRRQICEALKIRSTYGAELSLPTKAFSFQAMDVRWGTHPTSGRRKRMGHDYWVRAEAKTKTVGKKDSLLVSAKEPRTFINGRTG